MNRILILLFVRQPQKANMLHPKHSPALAKDENWKIRWNVAQNPSTSSKVLAPLAKDEKSGIRYQVAQNPNVSPETLTVLANDENEFVRKAVAPKPEHAI